MSFLSDLSRFLYEIVTSEQVAHAIKHMSRHAFQHFMKHNAPHLWNAIKDNIVEVFAFVQEWIADMF